MSVWRESASLILIARAVFSKNTNYDYKFLCLQRSAKSDFMPNTYVFPGGNLSESDYDVEWLKLFESNGYKLDSFKQLIPKKNIPEILQNNNRVLLKELAFRICAIRETFEECGVLLCRTGRIRGGNPNWASYMGGSNLLKWQHLVHDNAKEFLNLCTQCEIYPDVWALRNWINWITPAALPKRFNTLFFLATINQVPHIQSDQREVDNFMWSTPDYCLQLNHNETIMLPVPQFYEISRLQHFRNVKDLSEFASQRSDYGFESYWPYRIQTDEGLYSILPGDDLYPNRIDINNTEVDHMDQLPHSNIKHRILHKSIYKHIIITEQFRSKSEHVVPGLKQPL